MEVHHHSHTSRKKWVHYFWEFFMLFAAVFCGFMAENWREHYIENKRTKILAASLYEDIRQDTANLNYALKFSKEKIDSVDAAIRMFHLPFDQWNDTLIYTNVNIATRVYPFERTTGTYEQIKASGSLRYFKQTIVNLFNAYDVQANKVLAREDIDIKFILEQLMPHLLKHMNSEISAQIRFNQPISGELYYSKMDKENIRLIINHLLVIKVARQRAVQEYESLFQRAVNVLTVLKQSYNLK